MILSVTQFATRERQIDEWLFAREHRRFQVAKRSRPRRRARWFTRVMRATVARHVGALRADSDPQTPAAHPRYWPESCN
jgi:hypothetical protein